MWRDVFAYSKRPEIYLDADNICSLFPELGQPVESISTQLSSLSGAIHQSGLRWKQFLAQAEPGTAVQNIILQQTAPLAACMGAALHGMSAPGVFEDAAHLHLLTLLADDVGVGHAENGRFDRFCALARVHGAYDVATAGRELRDNRDIRDICFRFPATLYAMSRRSDAFDYELIGFDYAWRTAGLLPVWQSLDAADPALASLNMGRGQGAAFSDGENLLPYSQALIDGLGAQPAAQKRCAFGIALFEALMKELDEAVLTIVRSQCNPRLAMAILIQERAREAQVYHEGFSLEGRPLSRWFAEARDNPLPLVDAIGRSRLVRPGMPERSALVNGLVSDNGPMFRIFSKKDILTIRRWILSLADAPAADEAPLPAEARVASAYREVRAGDCSLGVRPGDIRSAFYLLQGRALTPGVREFARRYCSFWLEKSQDSVDKSARAFPPAWSPGVLREWLLASHDAHAQRFSASQDAEMPTREAVIAQTLQLAPLTLIDGAWLQGFTDITLASTRTGSRLFETYWDELGNGQWRLNHPKIYRDVLAAMSITLPATGSLAFAQDPRFDDAAFQLPVYWLCLGKFPLTYRPEILGMNLAMELSGVGGTYRNAHRFLKHHGLPTTFVDLHNTIDNVSTGHAAWAAEAIDAWMHHTRDLLPVTESWARIRRGYESLAPEVDAPERLNFFSSRAPGPDATANLSPLLHRQLHSFEVAE
ncbi:iron-containing redox enzyme family protein [Enterobacter sp. RIT418]|nr:iron-containing redox enzyme family protein [Enterobacter sp. RIT 418]